MTHKKNRRNAGFFLEVMTGNKYLIFKSLHRLFF
jgi:hypothetical protein